MATFQNRSWEVNVFLELLGVPAVGVTYSSLTIRYKKFGQSSFTTRTIVSSDWVSLGNGFYTLKWPASLVDTLGTFLYTIGGAAFDNFAYGEFDVDPLPLALAIVPPNKCVVSGNIVDLGGNPSNNHFVTARLVELPAQASGSIITGDIVKTLPDYQGSFTLTLIQGSTVLIEVERTGYRNVQVVIPNAPTANLVDLLPPPA
jgi:hypothetical protein